MRFPRLAGFGALVFLALQPRSSAMTPVDTDTRGGKKVDEAKRLECVLFDVCLVIDIDGAKRLEAIDIGKLRAFKTKLMAAHSEEKKRWMESYALFRKDPANKGKKFDDPRPPVPALKPLGVRVRGRKAADEALKNWQEKWLNPLLGIKTEPEPGNDRGWPVGPPGGEPKEPRPRVNLVKNGGFETGRARSGLADSWTAGEWGRGAGKYSIRRSRTNAHEGKYSLVLRALSEGARPGVSTSFTLTPGKYEVVYWACANVGKIGFVKGSLGLAELDERQVSDKWEQFKQVILFEKKIFGANLKLLTSTVGVRIWLDDVEVAEID